MEQSFPIDAVRVRGEFPFISEAEETPVYLDSAATSLKPVQVINAIVQHYQHDTANVGRGLHFAAERATSKFANARQTIASFINASPDEIVFVRNATEAINLVAGSLNTSESVAFGAAEHHSNYLPWSQRPRFVRFPVRTDGSIDVDQFQQILKQRPTLVAISSISNAFGTMNPVSELVALAHAAGARFLLDASQSVPHCPIDVRSLDCDYLCFSGHKMCGPMGIGVLYCKGELINELRPLSLGGGVVKSVSETSTEWQSGPARLEAGTPFVEGAVGLAAACEYLDRLGLDRIQSHVHHLTKYALNRLSQIRGLTIWGAPDVAKRGPIVTWSCDRIDPHTVARVLSDRHRICVRSGFHCAEPAHHCINAPPTVRASFYLYNTLEEVDTIADALTTLLRFA